MQAVERCLPRDPSHRWPDARSLKLALGVSGEPQLPDTVQAVQGQGMLAGCIVLLVLTLLSTVEWPALLFSSMGLFALMYAFASARLMGESLSLGQSQRVIWAEPFIG